MNYNIDKQAIGEVMERKYPGRKRCDLSSICETNRQATTYQLITI